MKASYLLRFDDLCPTMDHGKWAAIQAILDRHAVKAMLAVVPNNRHPALMVDREDQDFWERMRVLQDRGWAIALHGLTHLYTQRAVSLVVPGEAESEFAGLPTEIQCEKIGRGLQVLKGKGIRPDLWIAPNNTFDRATLSALKSCGIVSVSAGASLYPFIEDGVFWLPQQIWKCRKMPFGVWTVCLHPNTMTEQEIRALDLFLANNRTDFTDFSHIQSLYSGRVKSLADRVFTRLWIIGYKLKFL